MTDKERSGLPSQVGDEESVGLVLWALGYVVAVGVACCLFVWCVDVLRSL